MDLNSQIVLLCIEAESCLVRSEVVAKTNKVESVLLSMAADSYFNEAVELSSKLSKYDIN